MARIKHYTGVSNQALFPPKKRPLSLKTSTAQYIHDYPKIQDHFRESLIQYHLDAIDESIVFKLKQARRWIKKGNYNEVIAPASSRGNIEKVKEVIRNVLISSGKYNDTLQITGISHKTDISTQVRQLVREQFGYDGGLNTLYIDGEQFWLEDVKIVLQIDPGLPQLGTPFTAGFTPFRDHDPNRPHTGYTISPSGDYFEVIGVFGAFNFYEHRRTIKAGVVIGTTPEQFAGSIGMNRSYEQSTPAPDKTIIEVISDDGVTRVEKVTRREGFKRIKKRKGNMSSISATPNGNSYDPNTQLPKSSFEYTLQISWIKNGQWVEEILIINEQSDETIVKAIKAMTVTLDLDFIPRLYFRYDKKWLEDGELYKQSRKYSKKLNYPYKQVQKYLRKDIEKNNKDDMDKISSIYLTVGVNIMGKEDVEIAYIFHWFQMYFRLAAQQAGQVIDNTQSRIELPGFILDFGFKLDKQVFFADKIIYRKSSGNIGKVGTYKREDGTVQIDDEVFGTTEEADAITIIYQKDANTLEAYSIVNPKIEMDAFDGHLVSISPSKEKDDDTRLILPIYFDYIEDIKNFNKREKLILACMHLEFTTHFSRKKKWYESGLFKVIVVIVIAIISVVTSGAGLSLYAVLSAIGTSIAISVAVSLIMKVLTKILPLEILKVIAVVLAVVAIIYGAFDMTAFSKAFGILQMNANTLLSLSQQFMSAYQQKAMGNFMKEAEEWRRKYRDLEKYKEGIRATRITINTDLSTERTRNPIIVGETPSQMIARTINTTIGLLPIQYISQSVAYSLTLPTLEESTNRRMQYEKLQLQSSYDPYSEWYAARSAKHANAMAGESSWSIYGVSERESEPDSAGLFGFKPKSRIG